MQIFYAFNQTLTKSMYLDKCFMPKNTLLLQLHITYIHWNKIWGLSIRINKIEVYANTNIAQISVSVCGFPLYFIIYTHAFNCSGSDQTHFVFICTCSNNVFYTAIFYLCNNQAFQKAKKVWHTVATVAGGRRHKHFNKLDHLV